MVKIMAGLLGAIINPVINEYFHEKSVKSATNANITKLSTIIGTKEYLSMYQLSILKCKFIPANSNTMPSDINRKRIA